MTIDEFSNKVTAALERKLGEKYRICCAENVKNNGIVLHGLSIRQKEEMVSPTIYMEPFYRKYEDGESFEDICEVILTLYHDSRTNLNFDGDYFTDFNKIKDRICFKLCNTEKNLKLLKEIPSVPFKDLSIIFYIFINDSSIGNGQVLIKNDLFLNWNINDSELMDYAQANTPRLLGIRFSNILNVLEEMAKKNCPDAENICMNDFDALKGSGPALYVLSNKESFNGASSILYTGELEKVSEEIDDNYFIIPSSVHELIIVPESMEIEGKDNFNNKCTTLLDMIHNVNMSEVPESDFLSDNLYYYDRAEKTVSLIDAKQCTA